MIYELVGILGYLTFGEKVGLIRSANEKQSPDRLVQVPSNVMTAYHDSLFINICRAGIVIFILFR